MSSRVGVKDGDLVLDLGCGTGNLIDLMKNKYPNGIYTGVDVSPGMLKTANKKFSDHFGPVDVTLVKAEIMAYLREQPDAKFDHIVSMNVLYTISDQPALWKELMRVLKPAGQIVVTTSTEPGSGAIIKEHFLHSSLGPL